MPTNSQTLELVGRQTPSLARIPARAGSRVEDVLDLCDVVGLRNDPWQVTSLDLLTSVDEDDLWACTEFGELVARQNGKGNIILPYELAHLFLWPREDGQPKLIVHTAHEFKTAQEAFKRIERVIRNSPMLRKELKPDRSDGIRTSHGDEGFELANGNRLRFLARSKNSGVGFTCDVLIVDEAQQTPLAAMDALLPTMSAVPNHQILFAGTVPDELDDSEYFEGLRDRGRSGSDIRTGWIEFTPDGSHDPDLADAIDVTDRDVWAQSNPALGIRMKPETIEDELSRMSRESFMRERLSIWPSRRPDAEIELSDLDLTQWIDNGDPTARLGEAPVIALALGRGGGFATVAVASRADEESIFVEHKKTERGTVWVARYVAELKKDLGNALLVLDAKNAAVIINDLDTLGIKYLSMNLDEIAGAHAMFIEYSNAKLLVHRGQEEVTNSLRFATTRPLARSGFTWEPSDPSKPISHAQAVTWAAWGVKKSEASPPKKPAVVRGYA